MKKSVCGATLPLLVGALFSLASLAAWSTGDDQHFPIESAEPDRHADNPEGNPKELAKLSNYGLCIEFHRSNTDRSLSKTERNQRLDAITLEMRKRDSRSVLGERYRLYRPTKTRLAIREGRVEIGMNQYEVISARGWPEDINRTVTARSKREQWVYGELGDRTYVYFRDGLVTSYQD